MGEISEGAPELFLLIPPGVGHYAQFSLTIESASEIGIFAEGNCGRIVSVDRPQKHLACGYVS